MLAISFASFASFAALDFLVNLKANLDNSFTPNLGPFPGCGGGGGGGPAPATRDETFRTRVGSGFGAEGNVTNEEREMTNEERAIKEEG